MRNYLLAIMTIVLLMLCSCGGGGGGSAVDNTTNPGGGQQQTFTLPDIAGRWTLSLIENGATKESGKTYWQIAQNGNNITITNPDDKTSVYSFSNTKLSIKVHESYTSSSASVDWNGDLSEDGKVIAGTFIGIGEGAWSGTFTGTKK